MTGKMKEKPEEAQVPFMMTYMLNQKHGMPVGAATELLGIAQRVANGERIKIPADSKVQPYAAYVDRIAKILAEEGVHDASKLPQAKLNELTKKVDDSLTLATMGRPVTVRGETVSAVRAATTFATEVKARAMKREDLGSKPEQREMFVYTLTIYDANGRPKEYSVTSSEALERGGRAVNVANLVAQLAKEGVVTIMGPNDQPVKNSDLALLIKSSTTLDNEQKGRLPKIEQV